MKRLFFLVLAILAMASCQNPANISVQQVLAPAIPAGWEGMVDEAKYIRTPNVIASRTILVDGRIVDDPIAAMCTEVETVYMFYSDNSVVQFFPIPGRYDLLMRCAQIDVELHNRDNPNDLWGAICVGPPPPPPANTSNDPVIAPLQYALVDEAGVIHMIYTCDDNADYLASDIRWQQYLELYNRDNDPDCHIVRGGTL